MRKTRIALPIKALGTGCAALFATSLVLDAAVMQGGELEDDRNRT